LTIAGRRKAGFEIPLTIFERWMRRLRDIRSVRQSVRREREENRRIRAFDTDRFRRRIEAAASTDEAWWRGPAPPGFAVDPIARPSQ
jgi:hypothetical protein